MSVFNVARHCLRKSWSAQKRVRWVLRRICSRVRRDVFLPLRNLVTSNAPIRIVVAKVDFRVSPESADVAAYWSGGRFEKREIEFVVDFSGPNATFFDVGANCGLFALAVAKKWPRARVFAFEPSLRIMPSCSKT